MTATDRIRRAARTLTLGLLLLLPAAARAQSEDEQIREGGVEWHGQTIEAAEVAADVASASRARCEDEQYYAAHAGECDDADAPSGCVVRVRRGRRLVQLRRWTAYSGCAGVSAWVRDGSLIVMIDHAYDDEFPQDCGRDTLEFLRFDDRGGLVAQASVRSGCPEECFAGQTAAELEEDDRRGGAEGDDADRAECLEGAHRPAWAAPLPPPEALSATPTESSASSTAEDAPPDDTIVAELLALEERTLEVIGDVRQREFHDSREVLVQSLESAERIRARVDAIIGRRADLSDDLRLRRELIQDRMDSALRALRVGMQLFEVPNGGGLLSFAGFRRGMSASQFARECRTAHGHVVSGPRPDVWPDFCLFTTPTGDDQVRWIAVDYASDLSIVGGTVGGMVRTGGVDALMAGIAIPFPTLPKGSP